MGYQLIEGGDIPIKAWVDGVPCEEHAKAQLRYASMVNGVGPYIAVMPDVHAGRPICIGAVIPTRKCISPGFISGDIGCGVICVKTTLTSHQVSDNGREIEQALHDAIPVEHWEENDRRFRLPNNVVQTWKDLYPEYRKLIDRRGKVSSKRAAIQLGSLGRSNHFFSVNIDENDNIHLMLHSGSRNVGARIAETYVELAVKEAEKNGVYLPNKEYAMLQEGTEFFDEYFAAMLFAQEYARLNRVIMMDNAIKALKQKVKLNFETNEEAINCHHNYASYENHFGEDLYITRKGAIYAGKDAFAVIPGCMGGKSFIVRGKGNPDSFMSASHGGGRLMSRSVSKQNISIEQHRKALEGIICNNSKETIDESPSAYKNIENVMKAQDDLVDIVHTLKEMVSIKGTN